MKKIYSNKYPEILLHLTGSIIDLQENRIDIAPEEEFLQLALLKMPFGKTFKPHKHIIHKKTTDWKITLGQRTRTCFFLLTACVTRKPRSAVWAKPRALQHRATL